MKRTYLIVGLIASGTLAIAQNSLPIFKAVPRASDEKMEIQIPDEKPGSKNKISSRAAFDTIWYEDFANGINSPKNGNWKVVDKVKIAGVDFCPWRYTTEGPKGDFSTGTPPLASSTGANGFMILDGNLCNPNANTPGAKTKNVDSYLQTPAIDLTNYPNVKLNFQHRFRYCCNGDSVVMVQVSNDNVKWVNFDLTKATSINRGGISVNDGTANPIKESINISEVAGGQATVYIRFYQRNTSHYFWMLDDVAIIEAPDNDIVIDREYVDFYYTDGGYYNQTPLEQVDSIFFRSAIHNYGGADQHNVNLSVEVTKNNTSSVYKQKGPADSTLAKFMRDTLHVTTAFIPGSIGDYSIRMDVAGDETEQADADNTAMASLSVSDTVFARDNGDISRAGSVGPNYYIDKNGHTGEEQDADKIVTLFQFPKTAELTSISVYISASSDTNTTIVGKVYDVPNLNELLTTEYYDIRRSSDKGKWVTLPFNNKDGSVDIIAEGGAAWVGIEIYGTTDPATGKKVRSLMLASDRTTRQPQATTLVYIYDGWGRIDSYRSQPYIRINVANTCTTPLALTGTSTEDKCNQGAGTATVTTTDGTPPYNFAWNNGQHGATATGLKAGTYMVKVSDSLGCSASKSFTIGSVGSLPSLAVTTNTTTGCGAKDGSAEVVATGNGPFTYQWNDSTPQSTDKATGLRAGIYNVVVTDNDGCKDTVAAIVNDGSAPVLSITGTDVTCNGKNNGMANLTVTGGSGSQTYSWNTNPVQTTQNLKNLEAGIYSVSVKDGNCNAFASVTITDPAPITITLISTVNSDTLVAQGSLMVSAKGGTGALTYSWSPSGGNDSVATNLLPGRYTVTVTDVNGCSEIETYEVFAATGIMENQKTISNLNVYPNPANSNITVSFTVSQAKNTGVRLLGMNGEVIYSEILKQPKGEYKKTIDLGSHSNGIYFLQIISDKEIITKKVVRN